MIYFLPVLLMCIGDDCKFYADPPQVTEQKCQARFERIIPELEKSETVKAYKAACIKIQLGRDT